MIKNFWPRVKLKVEYITRKNYAKVLKWRKNRSKLAQDIIVLTPAETPEEVKVEIYRRFGFFFPNLNKNDLKFKSKLLPKNYISPTPILTYGNLKEATGLLWRVHPGVHSIDQTKNPTDGWAWFDAATNYYPDVDLQPGKIRLEKEIIRLRSLGFEKCYLFGTGPSLERASTRQWDDGLRVVCNTIVRDKILWDHIDPHLFVAGDAIYHFGFTEFACAFRSDLKLRMAESKVLFLYPSYFDSLIRREFAEFAERLVPIPTGTHTNIHISFSDNFATPAMPNVLNKLLLPVGCNLSRKVCLWGFDGRAPKDVMFWANSAKQSYSELMPHLTEAHPAFFDEMVPKSAPEKYVQTVHGDLLENCLSNAEAQGWTFEMLHPTWTPTLSKRLSPNLKPLI